MAEPLYRGYSTVAKPGLDTSLTDIALIKQDLLNHFQTRLGERVGRPTFGSIIHNLLLDISADDDRLEAICHADATRICQSDPRVSINEITVEVDSDSHEIVITPKLVAVETGQAFDLMVKFTQDGVS